MHHIEVDLNVYTHQDREPDPDDGWDHGDESMDVSINGIKVVAEPRYRDISVHFEPQYGQPYYLLWAHYSTGDSFGSNDAYEIIDLFQTHEAAQIAHDQLLKGEGYNKQYTRDDGTTIDFCVPWEGYFESLHNLNIDHVLRL